MNLSLKSLLINIKSSYWLIAFIFLIIPSVYVIFLLNATIQREIDALKNEISKSYKTTLISTTRDLSQYWQKIEKSPITDELAIVLDTTGADSAIIYNRNGQLSFPIKSQLQGTLGFAFSQKYQKALDLQKSKNISFAATEYEELLELARNEKEEAIAILGAAETYFSLKDFTKASVLCNKLIFIDRYKNVKDSEGQLILLNAQILFLQLEPQKSNKFNNTLSQLLTILNSYNNKEIPTRQRLELSDKLTTLFPDLYLPLTQAENIALNFIKVNLNPDRRNILQKAPLSDYWQYTIQGRNTLLFSKDTLQQQLLPLIELAAIPDKTMIRLVSPDDQNPDAIVSIPAANRMPGWQISLNFIDPDYLQSLIYQKVKVYRLTAILVIGFSLFLGGLFLRDMKKRVQLADLKNNLVANVTHELKTPLASSKILLDTLMSHQSLPTEKVRDYLRHLSTENTRLCNLVEHFLTFSKLDKNQYNFQFRLINSNELIEQLEEAINGRFVQDRKRIKMQCDLSDISLNIDSQAIITVILNLIENALKFSSATKEVHIKIKLHESHIHFAVIDYGCGISSKDQNLIFQRFFQTDSKLSKKHDGCGLGLSIVKTVLKAHKSRISLESQLNKGSNFSFLLEIKQGEL